MGKNVYISPVLGKEKQFWAFAPDLKPFDVDITCPWQYVILLSKEKYIQSSKYTVEGAK